MRVLGIDPGAGRTGVAVVEGTPGRLSLVEAACLEPVPQTSEPRRLAHLLDLVTDTIVRLRPDVASVEQLFFSTNKRTAMRVSEARGVVLCALGMQGVTVAEYTPMQVKEAVCGYGGARKPQVARMAAQLLGVESLPGPDDVADACAIAVCHHHRARLGALIGTRRTGSDALDAAVARARARLAGVVR
jgi:crossover junction endodeoxyribonuclease RuvC